MDISASVLSAVAATLAAQFPAVDFLQNVGNIANEEDVERLVGNTMAKFGRIDYAVNNAAVGAELRPTAEVPLSDYEKVLNINLKGTWLCEKAELKVMEAQEPLVDENAVYVASPASLVGNILTTMHSAGRTSSRGAIVNVDSVLGMLAVPGNAIYAMSKHGTHPYPPPLPCLTSTRRPARTNAHRCPRLC